MPDPVNAKSRRTRRPLYFAAKISDYQFRKVLWHFTLDHSAREAARHIALSANSITTIYAKLRQFFFDYGLFNDPYKGGDPRAGLPYQDFEDVEYLILAFHLDRVKQKRGSLDCRMDEPDHHFAESNWRFDYLALRSERGIEFAERRMYATLLRFIRRFGPVGAKDKPTVRDRLAGSAFALDLMFESVLWLERNSAKFRDPEKRAELREMRDVRQDSF